MERNKSFQNKPMLYLISTPIGNLGEISKRTIEVLESCDLVGAEDTRNSSNLLNYLGIKKPMISVHEHNERAGSEQIVNKIKEGKTVAYMSDAGYPGISDPGVIIVEECIKNDIPVSVVNGSSAFLTALVASGLPTNHFYFYGFLPSKDSDAKKELERLVNKNETLIFYESPHRIIRTLELLALELGDRKACLARELTKINEEYIRGTLNELKGIDEATLKGEMVLIIEGNTQENLIDDNKILKRYEELLLKNISSKTCIEIVSEELEINKNYVKSLVISKK
ncbi:MAG: 16S rRNA (cytidine(1402)-2'-O)-methyltransferase [Bacilli bacterium]|nr:16S rRNA (cytidine(1402)-2'-O)-methyltransferase [Bacilli bacterium]